METTPARKRTRAKMALDDATPSPVALSHDDGESLLDDAKVSDGEPDDSPDVSGDAGEADAEISPLEVVSNVMVIRGGRIAERRKDGHVILQLHSVTGEREQFWKMNVTSDEACRMCHGVPACDRPFSWKNDAFFIEFREAVFKVSSKRKTGKARNRTVTIRMKSKGGEERDLLVESTTKHFSVAASLGNLQWVCEQFASS
jgi:hypothetical protein